MKKKCKRKKRTKNARKVEEVACVSALLSTKLQFYPFHFIQNVFRFRFRWFVSHRSLSCQWWLNGAFFHFLYFPFRLKETTKKWVGIYMMVWWWCHECDGNGGDCMRISTKTKRTHFHFVVALESTASSTSLCCRQFRKYFQIVMRFFTFLRWRRLL